MLEQENYYLKGQLFEKEKNYRAAYLCYLQGACYSSTEEKEQWIEVLEAFERAHPQWCNGIVVVVTLPEDLVYAKAYIEGISRCINPLLCELVCVVRDYQDEVRAWLETQEFIVILEARKEETYGTIVSEVVEAYGKEDILLVKSNGMLLPDAVFNMAMVLAECDEVGIVATCPYQSGLEVDKSRARDIWDAKICFDNNAGILIRNDLFKEGIAIDKDIVTDKCMEIDLCVQGLLTGWMNVESQNALGQIIYCSEEENNGDADLTCLINKWGFDVSYYNAARTDLISMMSSEKEERIRVLEIGCGTGATLLQIKKRFPKAEVFGLELMEQVAQLGGKLLPITCGNVEDRSLEFPEKFFDYVILGDVLEHLVNPEETLLYLKKFLKENGYIIASIPNVQHYSAFVPLLFGEFEYFDAGIQDRTHLRFFTLRSIQNMFERLEFEIVDICSNIRNEDIPQWVERVLDRLCAISSEIERQGFIIWQYYVKVRISKTESDG